MNDPISTGPLLRVLGLLDKVRRSGSGYEASCPGTRHAHGDRRPSLSVGLGQDGRVLLDCKAGCDIEEILTSIGLTFADLFEKSASGNPIRRFNLGNGISHVREEKPEGKIIRWDTNGKNGLNGVRTADLPLYRAGDLATTPGPVIVTEGEKAAQALADAGMLAVGTVTGASGTPSDAAVAPLCGREVWLWPDNDDVGREHMVRIAEKIKPAPQWIDWKTAPEHGDAADYIAEGGAVSGIRSLLRPPRFPVEEDEFSAADLMDMDLAEPRWAVPGIFPEGVVLLVGKSKLGKSWLALDAAIAVAEGGVAWGAIEVQQGDVFYLALEDSKKRLQDRLRTLCKNGAPEALTIRITSPRANEGGIEKILSWLDRHPRARMVIIDVLGKFRPKESNSRRLYDLDYEAIGPLVEVTKVRGVCVLVVHHANKLNPEDPVDSVSGTTGLVGAADAICIFRRERGKADASLFVVGRDVEEQDLAFKNTLSQPGPHAWEMIGDAAKLRLSEQRKEIIDAVASLPGMSAAEVCGATGKSIGATRYLLFQMTREGQVRNRDGRYFPSTLHTPPITPITLSTPTTSDSQYSPYRGYRAYSNGSADSPARPQRCRWCGKGKDAHSADDPIGCKWEVDDND